MSGYVARMLGGLGIDENEIQFLLESKKFPHKEKIFESREAAIKFLREEMHYAIDDLKYMFWFEEGEDIKRDLLTNKNLCSNEESTNKEDF